MKALPFATAVIYTSDVPATVAFYERATGLTPSYYDREFGFAQLGVERLLLAARYREFPVRIIRFVALLSLAASASPAQTPEPSRAGFRGSKLPRQKADQERRDRGDS